MLNKTFDIALNTMFQGHQPTTIFVNQGDIRSVIFNFRIYEDANELDYSLVESAKLWLIKRDGNMVEQILQPQGSGYTVLISQQALAVVGTVTGAVALYGHGKERITTLVFTFLVGADILSRHAIESTTEFDSLQRAIALLESAIRLYEEFPRLKVLGLFEFESELLATFPDGSNINGGFWVGSEYEGRYFFWDRTHNRWTGIDPNRGRTGNHIIPINEPKTARELHDMGVRVGDSVLVTAKPNTSDIGIVVAGQMRYAGTVLLREGDEPVDESFVDMDSIQGAMGLPGEHNPRGAWSEDVTDYQRFDTVFFEGGTYNTYMYFSRIPNLQESPKFAGTEGNPWMPWVLRGADGEAATIKIGEVTTVASNQPARVEDVGSPTHSVLEIDIPQGKAASFKIRNIITVESEEEVRAVNLGTPEDAIYDVYLLRGERGEADGTMNHAELENLTYENSGHIGFASMLALLDEVNRITGEMDNLRNQLMQTISAISPSSIGAAPTTHTHTVAQVTGTVPVNQGGTGITSFTANNYIRASGATALQQRTPAQVLGDIGAATASHTHAIGQVSGTVPVNQGGTGATTALAAREAIGANSAANLSTGTLLQARFGNNTIPSSALINVSNIGERVSIGLSAFSATDGGIAIGRNANSGNLTGFSIAIGDTATVTTGINSIALGSNASAGASTSVALGRYAHTTHTAAVVIASSVLATVRPSTATNQILLGFSGVTPTAFAALVVTSDERDKINISSLQYDALKFINLLSPSQYRMDFRLDYVQYKEITEKEFTQLDPYSRQHDVISQIVYHLEDMQDVEWIESPLEGCPQHKTEYICKYVSSYGYAKILYRHKNPTSEYAKHNDLLPPKKIARRAKFLRVFRDRDGSQAGKRYHNGFIAQEVEEVAKSMDFDFAGVKYFAHNKDENGVPTGDDMYGMAYEEFIAPIVGAIQQLTKKVEAQQEEIAELKKLIRSGR
jgi:hypothetical protein